ncbi:MAG: TlpA family protein disulfide reductase [bacterium]|nr:TlpA family protein disulfide reductase [bacterium]
MKTKTLLVLFTALLLVGFMTSCKKSGTDKDDTWGTQVGYRVGTTPITFSENDTDGNVLGIESLRGKVVLINFSTMWCGPCRMEAGQLNELYNTYKERGFEIVQCICEDEEGNPADQEDINRWKDEFSFPFFVLNDPDYSTVNAYNLSGYPTNILLSKDFVIELRMDGFNKDQVVNKIESLL